MSDTAQEHSGITMLLKCLVLLSCIAVTLSEEYASYYVPDHHAQVVRNHYDDGDHHGHHGAHEYDHGGHRQLQNIHDSHGSRSYGHGENHGVRDIAQHAHHNQGAHAALHASGGQDNHVRKSHDRGFYEREKKYGYEKAYGYERETKHHDKSDNAHSHGSRYHHNENKGHYNQGGHALRDHAAHGSKHHHGSEVHGGKDILIDLSDDHNRGGHVDSSYDSGHHLRDVHLVPKREPLRKYFLSRGYISDVDGSLNRFRHLSGIHGLGGLRSYGQGYGYNPLRYGYSPVLNNHANHPANHQLSHASHELNYANHEPRHIEQPLHHQVPESTVYYIRHQK